MIAHEALIKKIVAAFGANLSLGTGHTLAACDYYDEWRCFPEDAEDYVLSRGCGIEETLPADCDDSVKNEMLWEMNNKQVKIKTYSFLDVDHSYLERFCFGVPYLGSQEFIFYFCAWMNRYSEGAMNDRNMINELLFSEIERKCSLGENSKLKDITDEQISVIAMFLSNVKCSNLGLAKCSENCLNGEWALYCPKSGTE